MRQSQILILLTYLVAPPSPIVGRCQASVRVRFPSRLPLNACAMARAAIATLQPLPEFHHVAFFDASFQKGKGSPPSGLSGGRGGMSRVAFGGHNG